jgi:sulfur carrier protein ThiS
VSAVTVFVNERPVTVPAGSTVAAAVDALDAALAARIAAGEGHVTDARGIELPPDTLVRAGTILRVVLRARQGADADA